MQPADFQRFKSLMTGMGELYQRELSAPLLDAYWVSLGSWSLEDFEAAAGQLMRTNTFMPRPADFSALRKAGRLTVGEAWALALECGRRGARSSGDPLVDRAVRTIGGFNAIGMSDVDKTPFLERRFCEHFESISDADEIRDAVPQIAYSSGKALAGPRRIDGLLRISDSWEERPGSTGT